MFRTFDGEVVELNGQQAKIYKHLKSHGSISQLEALGVYGIYRLAARVCEMRRKGVPIDSVNKHDANGKVYASYFLNPEYKWREPVVASKHLSNDECVPFVLENGYKVTLRQNDNGSFSVRVYQPEDTDHPLGQNIIWFDPTSGEYCIINHFHDKKLIPKLELL